MLSIFFKLFVLEVSPLPVCQEVRTICTWRISPASVLGSMNYLYLKYLSWKCARKYKLVVSEVSPCQCARKYELFVHKVTPCQYARKYEIFVPDVYPCQCARKYELFLPEVSPLPACQEVWTVRLSPYDNSLFPKYIFIESL